MGNNKPWGTIPVITAAGYMDIGKHLEFHYDNTTGSDYSTVLACTGNHSNIVTLPSRSGTLALTTDNVYSATKLQTARSLWGNSFNGTSDINGSIIVPSGKYISIGNIKMEYDATNKALKITNTTTNEVANLYTSGGVSAYGVGTSSSSGGGLNGSVKSYSDALKLTSESLSEIASAYSIKQLSTRITSLEGGSATSISVSGSGNAVTSVAKNGTVISIVKGATFLTSHQSLANYYTKSATDGLLAGKADRASAMTFKNDSNSLYVNASFESAELSKIASDKYIECWDGAGAWWNWKSGKYIVAGGTSSQFLKADGSLDSNTYSRIGEVLKSIDFTSENSSFDANNLRKAITFAYKTSKHINTATTGTIVDFCCTNEKYSFQLQSSYMSDGLYYRRNNSDKEIWGDWVRLATINDIPKSLPASDVYAWAKASTKPSYSWSEIGSRPTKVSQFTNDSGYITSSGSITGNAATATKLQTARTIWGQSFNGTANVNGSITGVDNITMSNNSYLYGKNTGGTAIKLISMASWNSVDIGRGALTYGYTTQVMGKTVVLTASDDSGKNTKSVELSTAKFYSNVNIETEGGLFAHGGVTAYSSSDIRLKQDLRKLDYLGIIKAMGGTFGFAWKKDNTRSIGWIAQHVLCNPHLKDIVETDEKGYYKINYWSPKLIATAFGAIEQVGDEVSSLKARVVFLESEVQRLSGKQGSSNKKRLDNKNINLLN